MPWKRWRLTEDVVVSSQADPWRETPYNNNKTNHGKGGESDFQSYNIWIKCSVSTKESQRNGNVRPIQAVFRKLYHFAFLPPVNESSRCFTSSLAFGGVSVPDFGHSLRGVVVSWFICLFLRHRCGALFHRLICHLFIFFGEVSIRPLAHFHFQIVSLLLHFWVFL